MFHTISFNKATLLLQIWYPFDEPTRNSSTLLWWNRPDDFEVVKISWLHVLVMDQAIQIIPPRCVCSAQSQVHTIISNGRHMFHLHIQYRMIIAHKLEPMRADVFVSKMSFSCFCSGPVTSLYGLTHTCVDPTHSLLLSRYTLFY